MIKKIAILKLKEWELAAHRFSFFFHHDIHFQDYMIRAISAKERENARTYSWLLKHWKDWVSGKVKDKLANPEWGVPVLKSPPLTQLDRQKRQPWESSWLSWGQISVFFYCQNSPPSPRRWVPYGGWHTKSWTTLVSCANTSDNAPPGRFRWLPRQYTYNLIRICTYIGISAFIDLITIAKHNF